MKYDVKSFRRLWADLAKPGRQLRAKPNYADGEP